MPDPARTARRSVTLVQWVTGLPLRQAAQMVRSVALAAASKTLEQGDETEYWLLEIASCAYDIAHPVPATAREDAGHGRQPQR